MSRVSKRDLAMKIAEDRNVTLTQKEVDALLTMGVRKFNADGSLKALHPDAEAGYVKSLHTVPVWEATLVARFTNNPAHLDALAAHRSKTVIDAVVANPNTSPETISKLIRAKKAQSVDRISELLPLAARARADDVAAVLRLAQVFAHGSVLYETLARAVGPSGWYRMLQVALDADSTYNRCSYVAEAIVAAAVEANVPFQELVDMSKEFAPEVANSISRVAPLTNETVQFLLNTPYEISYVSSVTNGTRVLDDDALLTLFKADPSAVEPIAASVRDINAGVLPKTETWVLHHAARFPLAAYVILGFAPLSDISPEAVDAGLVGLASASPEDENLFSLPVAKIVNGVAPYRLSSEAMTFLVRHPSWDVLSLLQWLAGAFEHQLPTEDEIRAVFASPYHAFGTLSSTFGAKYIQDLTGFLNHLSNNLDDRKVYSLLHELLSQPWADVVVDLCGEQWPKIVTGSYLIDRIRRDVGERPSLDEVLDLLERSRVDLSTALTSAAALK